MFSTAKKHKGSFSKNLLCLLEHRLDVILYRSGITQTIAESRQFILHRKILVNDNPVDFPAFLVSPGDLISLESKTRDTLRSRLLESLKTQVKTSQSKDKLKIMPSIPFFSKLKKNFENQSSISSLIYQRYPSKEICHFLIQLLCTRLKLRCFYYVKFSSKTKKSSLFFNLDEKSKTLVTFLKWKSFSFQFQKLERESSNFNFSKKKSFKKMKNNLDHNNLTISSGILYANAGYLQQKPVLWDQSSLDSKQKKMLFFKNKKTAHKEKPSIRVSPFSTKWDRVQKDSKNFKLLTQKNSDNWNLKKQNLACRNSFLIFLKDLDKSKNFTGFVKLKVNQILSKNFFFREKSEFSSLTLRVIKPLHLEISYKLLNVIYLYSPQRLNFPFSFDLDVINRSLS